MGLSIYKLCRQGTSKPVNHISRTITIFSSSSGSRILSANFRRCSLLVWCLAISAPSEATEVITTLMAPLSKSSSCHSGLRATISLYSWAAIRLDMAMIKPLPSSANCRCSKCVTMSCATCWSLSWLPTKASSCVHFALAFWLSVSCSWFNSSSKSVTNFLPSALSLILAKRLS